MCENKDFCGVVMPSVDTKISTKNLIMYYEDHKSLIKKVDGCKNNSVESSTTKKGEHIPCGYSVSTI